MSGRNQLQVLGAFYVTEGCCTLCGVPQVTAPELFDDDGERCIVRRQPETDAELDAMFEVMRRQDLDCVRYRGSDPEILRRAGSLADRDGG